MKTRYNWDNAPRWAEWAARGSNGCCYWYEELPVKLDDSFDIEEYGPESEMMDRTDILDNTEYWSESLERRVPWK